MCSATLYTVISVNSSPHAANNPSAVLVANPLNQIWDKQRNLKFKAEGKGTHEGTVEQGQISASG